MKSLLSLFIVFSFTVAMDTLSDTTLNFSVVFPEEPSKTVKENNDTYGAWTNTNFTAYESHTKRTTSLIVKDYRKYDQTGTSGAAIVTVTANMLLRSLKAEEPFKLTLTKGEFNAGYSFADDDKQTRIYVYWKKNILYILMIEEPHTVGDSLLDEFPASFRFIK